MAKMLVGMSLVLAMALSETAFAQQIPIQGTVTNASGAPLRGVTVRVQGTDTRVFTNSAGRYSLAAPADAVLNFTLLGQRVVNQPVSGRTTIDVRMEPIAFLEEVVVTAYSQEQRRGEITGAVASVNLDAVARQTSASVLQRLDANVSGVQVENSGSPGSRSTVRIRGVTSFQNNDPLYIVDGTPVQDSYVNWLNPNDIASVQVLKDASAASIYGSRASNGVIIIETVKRGVAGPPRATFRARTGVASAVRGYDDFVMTDAMQYGRVVKQAYQNAGLAVPTNIYGDPNNQTLPTYTYADPALVTARDAFGRPTTVNLSGYSWPNALVMPASAGTNWWKAVFASAPVQDYNLDVNGGGQDQAYAVSFNYFDQEGTAKYNNYKRGSVRINTSFNRGRFNFGENFALAASRHVGGLPDDPGGYAEDGILGKNILMQPIIPLYDIAGNFAGGKSPTLGNQSNPLKFAWAHKDDIVRTGRAFGNVFGGFHVRPDLQIRSKFGFNLNQRSWTAFGPLTPENSEPQTKTSFNENTNQFTDWTWSNTANYAKKVSEHNLTVLLGQEANASTFRDLTGGIAGLLNTDVESRFIQDALGDATSKTVASGGGRSALLSFFGKADYNFADKYVASVTLRQDGSSRLGPSHRWGTFPAFGLGWRLSQEPFMANNRWLSDVMLRFGWGVTGNQQIPSGRIVSQFGGSRGDTYYDIGGTNNNVVAGYRQTSLGNTDLKWEENRSVNYGTDFAVYNGLLNVVVDIYSRNTNNLLFNPPLPATAGIAAPPIVNIGKMRNNGFDLSVGHRAAEWSLTWNGSHYTNKIVQIDGVTDFFYGPVSTRYGNQVINKVGHPIGSFYGLIADGFFRDAADVAAHATQDGAAPGRIKFRDICCGPNGEMTPDGQITLADRTIIGSPHPSFTSGVDFQYRRGSWDFSATAFGSFGNEIFDVQKEFYVFRNFSTNVRKDMLENSWRPVDATQPRAQWAAANPDAKYPVLDQNDIYSHAISSYYVEDGSYVRLRNLQIGYNVPQRLLRWIPAARVYFQAENLFTITGYEGLDPSLPAASVFGSAGDIRDQYRGIDRGSYPSNRVMSIGLVTNF